LTSLVIQFASNPTNEQTPTLHEYKSDL